jgi:pimeloyl-ACP methyl ester carboxylesterase
MKSPLTSAASSPLLLSYPSPARDYADALAKWADLQRLDDFTVNPACKSWMLTHERQTEHAVVLVHGITNCPAQYAQLAPLFYERGYNVLVPRLPWNGLLDRSGEAMRYLTAQELRAFGDSIVDIARGLGKRVTIAGLSGGGVVTAWAAQCRPDVEYAVVIAPAIGVVPELPTGNLLVNRLSMRLGRMLPNVMTQRFVPIKAGPPHNYFGFATRGLSSVMELGFAVLDAARVAPPAAASALVIVNENDPAVNGPVALELAHRWQTLAGDRTGTYVFPRDRGLIHDLIDPMQPAQQTSVVYPILLDLIAATPAPTIGAPA